MAIHEVFKLLKGHPDLWFTNKDIQKKTGLNRYQIERAIHHMSFFMDKRVCAKQPHGLRGCFQIVEYRFKGLKK